MNDNKKLKKLIRKQNDMKTTAVKSLVDKIKNNKEIKIILLS